jgi:NTP pyrophosphatase (non-canonical NTP hydrolase)
LGKNSFLDPYSPHAKWVTAQDAVNVKDKGEIQKLMEDWDEWRNKTFPNATPISHCIHLLKEVEELKQAIFHEHSKDEIGSEFADCFILLLNTASQFKLTFDDLVEFSKTKMEVNKKRKWGNPDKDGVVQHVEDKGEKEDEQTNFERTNACYGNHTGD